MIYYAKKYEAKPKGFFAAASFLSYISTAEVTPPSSFLYESGYVTVIFPFWLKPG